MPLSDGKVETSHGAIAYTRSSGDELPLVLLHGNSCDRHAFDRQLSSELASRHGLIAFDLPGHGASDDAIDPERTYTQNGYAHAITEALGNLGIERAAVYGWSLGGHVALEMIPLYSGIAGIMITGAPPIPPTFAEAQAGFQPLPNAEMVGKPELSDEEIGLLAYVCFGDQANDSHRAAIARTDGRARAVMFANLISGGISDQRRIAETSPVPIAVVNGEHEPLVNLEYLATVAFPKLWEDHLFVLRGAGHSPFWQVPEVFNPILGRFADDMAARVSKAGGASDAAVSAA